MTQLSVNENLEEQSRVLEEQLRVLEARILAEKAAHDKRMETLREVRSKLLFLMGERNDDQT